MKIFKVFLKIFLILVAIVSVYLIIGVAIALYEIQKIETQKTPEISSYSDDYSHKYLTCDDPVRKEKTFLDLAYDAEGNLNLAGSDAIQVSTRTDTTYPPENIFFSDWRLSTKYRELSFTIEESWIILRKIHPRLDTSQSSYTSINRTTLKMLDIRDMERDRLDFTGLKWIQPRLLGECQETEKSTWISEKNHRVSVIEENNRLVEEQRKQDKKKSLESRKI